MSDPSAVCGGVIGAGENKKFCVAHPSLCEFQLAHAGKKFQLGTDCFCAMSPKKGGSHATLVLSLPRNILPRNAELEDLLKEDRPVAMWHVCFDVSA